MLKCFCRFLECKSLKNNMSLIQSNSFRKIWTKTVQGPSFWLSGEMLFYLLLKTNWKLMDKSTELNASMEARSPLISKASNTTCKWLQLLYRTCQEELFSLLKTQTIQFKLLFMMSLTNPSLKVALKNTVVSQLAPTRILNVSFIKTLDLSCLWMSKLSKIQI